MIRIARFGALLLGLLLQGCGSEQSAAMGGSTSQAGSGNGGAENADGVRAPKVVESPAGTMKEPMEGRVSVAEMAYLVPVTQAVQPVLRMELAAPVEDRQALSVPQAAAKAAVTPTDAQKSNRFFLVVLDANPEHAGSTGPAGLAGWGERFHDWKIQGVWSVEDPDTQTALLASLENAEETHCRRGPCFAPEYGLRVNEGGHVTDYLVCCATRRVRLFEDGRLVREMRLTESPECAFGAVALAAGGR